jgi:hypothetical protein
MDCEVIRFRASPSNVVGVISYCSFVDLICYFFLKLSKVEISGNLKFLFPNPFCATDTRRMLCCLLEYPLCRTHWARRWVFRNCASVGFFGTTYEVMLAPSLEINGPAIDDCRSCQSRFAGRIMFGWNSGLGTRRTFLRSLSNRLDLGSGTEE